MHFLKLSLIILSFASSLAAANEGGSGEGGGGEGEGAKKEVTISKDQKEFVEKSAKLTTLTNRIADHDKNFQELVHQKALAKTAAQKQEIIEQMNELNSTRNKDIDAFNKVRSELALRYPNRGEQLNRRYETQSKRSVEEMEGVAGLDEMLTRTKKVIEKKFAPFMEDEKEKETKAKVATPEEEKPQKLRLEK